MEQRIKPLRAGSFAVLAIALLVCGPWVGWWTLIPLAIAGTMFALTDRGLESSRHPEYRVAVAWLTSELAIAVSVALTGGPRSPAVAWLVLPVVTLAARFNVRGVIAGSTVAGVLIFASAFGVDPAVVIASPQQVVFRLALLAAVALLSLALMRSDLQHRSASVIDPLTNMLNRNALDIRVDELRHQASIFHQPVGVIVADLDHFKTVNDTRGHAVGDAVLRDVAYTLRKRLRAFDLARAALDGARNVVVGHVLGFGCSYRSSQSRVAVGITAAGTCGHLDVLDQLREELAPLGVDRRLLVLGRGPFRVAAHVLAFLTMSQKYA